VLIIGSGNVVHNLGRIDWDQPDAGFPWARSFDDAARDIMTRDPATITELQVHEGFVLAAPTPDHFIPLLYLAGLAASAGRTARVLVAGYAMGSLSMTAYALDGPALESAAESSAAEHGPPPLPQVPGVETNV
jgi:4,5-DOPA dioxygenase extradiol